MGYRYDRRLDRMVGHDWPGLHGPQFHGFVIDEIELGARVAIQIDDPDGDQWWWNLQSAFCEGIEMTEHEQRPELKVWELATTWAAFAICALASAMSFRHGDHVWGFAFALLTVFGAVVLSAGHAQRRWNRHGEPDWVRRARQRRR